jgi:hypothetical protein
MKKNSGLASITVNDLLALPARHGLTRYLDAA